MRRHATCKPSDHGVFFWRDALGIRSIGNLTDLVILRAASGCLMFNIECIVVWGNIQWYGLLRGCHRGPFGPSVTGNENVIVSREDDPKQDQKQTKVRQDEP